MIFGGRKVPPFLISRLNPSCHSGVSPVKMKFPLCISSQKLDFLCFLKIKKKTKKAKKYWGDRSMIFQIFFGIFEKNIMDRSTFLAVKLARKVFFNIVKYSSTWWQNEYTYFLSVYKD